MSDDEFTLDIGPSVKIPVDKCVPYLRHAKDFHELKNMAKDHVLVKSLEEVGQIQPIVVQKLEENGEYQVIIGKRRWRAADLLEWKEIMAIVIKNELTDFQKKVLDHDEGATRRKDMESEEDEK